MSESTEYVAARDLKVGDVLVHPYTTWTITKISSDHVIDHHRIEATPSNPSYETVWGSFGNAQYERRK